MAFVTGQETGLKFLGGIWKAFLHILRELPAALPAFVMILMRRCRRFRERFKEESQALPCLPIPAGIWLQPDAYLYSQRYLMSLGIGVTWDNPDVQLTDMGGTVVGSHDLLPSTKYRIAATIHNRSNDAPAPGMPVVFTLFSFGAGGSSQPLGQDVINLPVRAAPGEPALASVVWETPPMPGHHCIQIEAVWATDANQLDNMGQHNTVIRGAARGERFQLRIPVMHTLQGRNRLRARLDSYVLPERPLRRQEKRESDASFRKRIADANAPQRFPPAEGWRARISPEELVQHADETSAIEFEATVPVSAQPGTEQRFNVAVSEESTGKMVGGVTVILRVT